MLTDAEKRLALRAESFRKYGWGRVVKGEQKL
jgi:hypothetical protein